MSLVAIDRAGAVAKLTLDRPPVNAVSYEVVEDLNTACAALEAVTRGREATWVNLDELDTEGGHASVYRRGDAIVRITGGLLFEHRRFYFDYFYRDGELLCATEPQSNVQVIMNVFRLPGIW